MIVTQPKEDIALFVAERIGTPNYWGNYTTLAKVDEKGIVVGVVYNQFVERPGGYQDCQMHVGAREGAKWCRRDFLYHAFAYPFEQMGCVRVTGLVAKKNRRARKLNEHLGFTQEACLRKALPGDDMMVYRLFKDDCRWLHG